VYGPLFVLETITTRAFFAFYYPSL